MNHPKDQNEAPKGLKWSRQKGRNEATKRVKIKHQNGLPCFSSQMAKTEPQRLAQIQLQNEHYWGLGLPTWIKARVCLEGLGGSFLSLKTGPF